MVPTNRRDGVSGRHGAYKWEGYCLSGREVLTNGMDNVWKDNAYKWEVWCVNGRDGAYKWEVWCVS